MKERPILFSAPMVRALLDGSKTQTRRTVTNPHRSDDGNFVLQDYGNGMWPYRSHDGESGCYIDRQKDGDYFSEAPLRCPYGRAGDRLWVRETWMDLQGTGIEATTGSSARCAYRADTPPGSYGDEARKAYGLKWTPAIHMFRWASRILLEITDVRVERLQDISEADCIAEGMRPARPDDEDARHMYSPRWAYEMLWNQLNGLHAWDANPWVWAVSFRPLSPGEHGRAAP